MLTKDQKRKFVEDGKNSVQKYANVGIVPLSGIPDRLLQSTKNRMKSEVKKRIILSMENAIALRQKPP